MAKTAKETYDFAMREVGYSRYDDPEQGTKYGRWYAKLTNSPYFGTTGVPFCAMGVSYVLYNCSVACVGAPTAACTSGFLRAARAAGKLRRCETAKFMDVVLFDWSGRGYASPEADHVGFIIENHGTWFKTWEANVSGAVKVCTRYPSNIVGVFSPAYAEEKTLKELPLLKKGDKGFAVGVLQRLLILRGVATFTNPDEVFGDKTEASVKSFQKMCGIGQDGKVGAKTWPALTSK